MTYAEVRERTAYYQKFGPLLWVVDAGALMTGLRFGPLPSDADRRHHLVFTAERTALRLQPDARRLAGYGAAAGLRGSLCILVTKWPGRYWEGKGFALSPPNLY